VESFFLVNLRAHAKFHNPSLSPSMLFLVSRMLWRLYCNVMAAIL
jgi:hypothetical protein